VNRNVLLLLGLMIFLGSSIAVHTGLLVPFIASTLQHFPKNTQLEYSFYAMTGLGLGMVLGGFVSGFTVDHLGKRAAIHSNVLIALLTFGLIIWYNEMGRFSMVFSLICTFLWGVMDMSLQTLLNY